MKVLMLGWELPPHNSGGLGKACFQLCKALSNQGVDIEFILPYTAEHQADFMKVTPAHPQGVQEITVSSAAYDSYKYLYEDGHEEWHDMYAQQLIYEKAVEKLVDHREFDIIHAHDWLTFRAAMRAKARSGCPVILHIHSIEHDRAGGKLGNKLVHEIEYMAMMMADRVIAVSNHTKKAIVKEYGIPANKIEVVHNSIDLTDTEPLDTNNVYHYLQTMKQSGYTVITNAGRLTIQKGLINFLQAAKLVVEHAPKTLFLVVGTGEQDYELMEMAAGLGISKNVIFTGFQRGKNLRDAYGIADLFVMPSVSEPFGLTPLEAAGYGTPALVSKQSGVAEVFHNCLKVDFWDIDEMANQIVAFIQNPALQHELAENALSEYQKLSWQPAADAVRNLYRQHVPRIPV
jgi:glycogen(starch) synthase